MIGPKFIIHDVIHKYLTTNLYEMFIYIYESTHLIHTRIALNVSILNTCWY